MALNWRLAELEEIQKRQVQIYSRHSTDLLSPSTDLPCLGYQAWFLQRNPIKFEFHNLYAQQLPGVRRRPKVAAGNAGGCKSGGGGRAVGAGAVGRG